MATTLGNVITKVLQRVNISTSVAAHQDQARDYINTMAVQVLPQIPLWFLNKTTTFKTTQTLTVTTLGTFTVGEEIEGGTSGETATVDHQDDTNSLLYVYDESGDFTSTGETLTGADSSATAVYVSDEFTRVYTPISGPVTNWWSFWDTTNARKINIIGYDQYDALDPERDDTGTVYHVLIGSMNDDTGYPELELNDIPSTTNTVIRVRYQQDIAAWTSANDASSMQVLGIPRQLEQVLQFGAAQLYLEEKRHGTMAATEGVNAQKGMQAVQAANHAMQGGRRYPRKRQTAGSELTIVVGGDTVSA